MPKLMFFGDPHGDFKPIIAAVQRYRPEAIILLGDVQARQPLHVELRSIRDLTQIWFIHGNHDTDSDADYDNLWGSELADRNLHGRVVEIAGYRVAGLGGVFRGRIWNPDEPKANAPFRSRADLLRHVTRGGTVEGPWRGGFARKHLSSIFLYEYEAMLGLEADILVSHEAPAAAPGGAYAGRHIGFQAIDHLAVSMGASLAVHGHHHRAIDYVHEGLMSASAPFRAFGVDMGSHLAWPLVDGRGPR
ncbi:MULTISPECIES: metallophosphoesterase [unclassified Variovorax]|uniref:metallophosphoesterase family protein n=1 Tax=unclassified Variovorax TaxID=663243 RepID=UPI00076C0B50|nr:MULTISPECIES: metallophosphoesterase [unclassified Variovorax]KWT97704.1 Metallophosphoesterase [Variovorax sp. WDL1]